MRCLLYTSAWQKMGVHRGNADNTFYLCTNGKFMVLSMLIFPCNLLYSIRIDFTSQEYLENKKRAKPLRSAYIAQCALFTPAALVELMGYIVIIDLWYPRKKNAPFSRTERRCGGMRQFVSSVFFRAGKTQRRQS